MSYQDKLDEKFNLKQDDDILDIEEDVECKDIEYQDSIEINVPSNCEDCNMCTQYTDEEIKNDFDFIREKYLEILDNAGQSAEKLRDQAEKDESPRAYSVYGELLSQITNTLEKFSEHHEKLQKIVEKSEKIVEKSTQSANTINNIAITGTSEDFQKFIERKMKND